MRRKLPETLELEAFVTVQCARATPEDVFSAIISTGATATAANASALPSYEIRERGNDGEYFTRCCGQEREFYSNSRDMCMAEHLNGVIDSGIISLKIEGRMKSILYVATVVNAYRMALDGRHMELVMNELNPNLSQPSVHNGLHA